MAEGGRAIARVAGLAAIAGTAAVVGSSPGPASAASHPAVPPPVGGEALGSGAAEIGASASTGALAEASRLQTLDGVFSIAVGIAPALAMEGGVRFGLAVPQPGAFAIVPPLFGTTGHLGVRLTSPDGRAALHLGAMGGTQHRAEFIADVRRETVGSVVAGSFAVRFPRGARVATLSVAPRLSVFGQRRHWWTLADRGDPVTQPCLAHGFAAGIHQGWPERPRIGSRFGLDIRVCPDEAAVTAFIDLGLLFRLGPGAG
jgi:hypothetical protein